MSQVIKNRATGPVPPAVATSYVTDVNSPAVPIANVLNVFGGDTTANNDNGIRTDGSSGSNTLTVQLTNRLQGTVTTVGTGVGPPGQADIITFSLGSIPGTFAFEFRVTAFDSSTPAGLAYFITGGARTTGATATIIGTPDGQENEEAALAAADWDVVSSGNDLILRVTGVAGLTINWGAVGLYTLVI